MFKNRVGVLVNGRFFKVSPFIRNISVKKRLPIVSCREEKKGKQLSDPGVSPRPSIADLRIV
jgi:hypothetical protein